MAASIDLDAIVRRLKPEKHKQIARRDETKLAFVDSEPHLSTMARIDHWVRRGDMRRLGAEQPGPDR